MSTTLQWILVVALAVAAGVIVWMIYKNHTSCNGCPLADGCARKGESRKCTLEDIDTDKNR